MEKKLKIMAPEEALEKFLKWFDTNKKIGFIVALVVGLIAHITMITETIMSQDGLWNSMEYFRPGDWEISIGRWGIAIIERLIQFIAIPTINTVLCILMVAITAVLIIDLLDFKSKVSSIFTALALVLTPTLVVTLLYIYTAFAYCFNLLISTFVIWLIYKSKHKKVGFILAALCFMFSLSIYQGYVGVTVGLCMMISILDLLKNNDIKEVFKNIGKTILALLIGGILYLGLTKIILMLSHIDASNYNNANSISISGIISGLGSSFLQTYKDFGTFFFGNDIVVNANYTRGFIYAVFFIMFALGLITTIASIKEENKKIKIGKISLIILFTSLLPIGLNIIDIIASGSTMYALTSVQMILIIPFAFAIFELLNKFVLVKWIAILSCFGVMWTYYLADNTSYAALKLTYNQAYSSTMRVMDRIETTPGYVKDMPILFGGIIGNNNYPRTSSLYAYTVGSIVNNTAFHGPYGSAMGTWTKFLKIFYGLDVRMCTAEEYYKIVTGDIYKNEMECFPAESSVRIMNGIVVIKLDEEPYLPY